MLPTQIIAPLYSITYGSYGTKSFWFEAMWVEEESCSQIIEQTWAECAYGDSIEQVMQLNSRCGSKLQQWKKTCFGNV